jgi:pSer/pThr/pTyr-binding forkhead associated (FHA) protein
MSGEEAGTVIPLVESEYNIGRQRDNQIQLNDLGVSARHARIFRGPEGYVVEDLKSRNGTWLNGTRIFHSILRNADEIRVGATDIRYEVLFDASNALGEQTAVKAR